MKPVRLNRNEFAKMIKEKTGFVEITLNLGTYLYEEKVRMESYELNRILREMNEHSGISVWEHTHHFVIINN